MTAATQMLESTRNKSVGFPVFPDHLGYVQELWLIGRNLDPNLIQQPSDLLTTPLLAGLELTLGKVLQEAAAGLTNLLRAQVEALQELVGNGDHHLGHGMSIYGIAGRQNGHVRIVKGRDARVARRK
jgi:hypothetical protein